METIPTSANNSLKYTENNVAAYLLVTETVSVRAVKDSPHHVSEQQQQQPSFGT